jgi:hypothetical protein
MDNSPRVLLFLALVAACSNAGTAQWVQYGPPGASGSVSSILKAGAGLFASTPGGGVSRSTNNGLSWQTANAGLTNAFLLSLATVRLAGGGTALYAGSAYAGMFTSTDNGTTWGTVTLALAENTVSALTVDGSSIYAGTTDGVLVSSDAGIHWKEITAGFTQSTVNSLLLFPGNLLAATTGGVFESSTRGATWTRMNEGLTAPNVNSISAAGTTLIAGTKATGAYVRTATDSAWKVTTLEGLISAVGSSGGTLLASPAGYGAYYSQDNGITWALGGPGTGVGVSIEGFPSSPPLRIRGVQRIRLSPVH